MSRTSKRSNHWLSQNYKWLIFGVSLLGVIPAYIAIFPRSQALSPECKRSNLIKCSTHIPVNVPNESSSSVIMVSGKLQTAFSNDKNGSGIALQFTPAVDVRGTSYLELRGTSSKAFSFEVQYKVRDGTRRDIVRTSASQSFPKAPAMTAVRVPLSYDGAVDELVINFFKKGEVAQWNVESILLAK